MTDGERLIAGIEAAIEFSTERLEVAFDTVPIEQWHYYTQNIRHLLYAQLRFYQALGGVGLPLYEPPPKPPEHKVNMARLVLR